MAFECRPIREWPPLSWVARCRPHGGVIEVFHGSRVETNTAWFCESVWCGDFLSADFDQTDVFFGSGARVRDGETVFVSSASTVDRLHSVRINGVAYVSNSLVALLAVLCGFPAVGYLRYYEDFRSIISGIRKYRRTLPTTIGPVALTYYHNLRWDGRSLDEVPKPHLARSFDSFSSYRRFLAESLRGLSANMSSADRSWPYRMLGTVSSGYDSGAVAALGGECGLREAITFRDARSGEVDDGQTIGQILGMEVDVVRRDAWRSRNSPWSPEVPFIAADGNGEDVYFSGVEHKLEGSVLLTGFHGDQVWNKDVRDVSEDVVRGDHSGLSLSEYRLWVGFIHCPVPFLGVRQIRDINAINRSPELSLWDVSGKYSRPICRRILEEAGVPRHLFGTRKKAASVHLREGREYWISQSLDDYISWVSDLSETPNGASNRLTPNGAARKILRASQVALRPVLRPFRFVARIAPPESRLGSLLRRSRVVGVLRSVRDFARRDPSLRYAFPWAIARALERYTLHSDHTSPPMDRN